MTLLNGADAANPNYALPADTDIVCGYVGAPDLSGQPDARHIWTMAQWNQYLDPSSPLYGGPQLRALPIYVHDYPGDPAEDAVNAADAVTDLGWEPHIGRTIVWDGEGLLDPMYVVELANALSKLGFYLTTYLEAFAAQHTPATTGGLWVPSLTPSRPRYLPPGWDGQQWQFGSEWDRSVFTLRLYEMCGVGMRHAPTS